jgi:hypothetical protein
MRNGLKALLICAAMATVWSDTGVGAAPPPTRSYTGGRFVLDIAGTTAGWVTAVEGGLAFADVVKEPGEEFFFKKHIGTPGFRDIRLEFGADMDKSFYSWIAQSLQGQRVSMNGAILSADVNNNVISRLEFRDALITEVTFPAADATSKDAAKMSIVLSPEHTVLNRKASGKINAPSAKTQKRWLPANFRFTIDGIDTKKVSKVEALTVKLPRPSGCDGETKFCEKLAGSAQVDFPDLVVTTGEPADSWYDWFEKFVIEGNSDDSQEKAGTLEYLSSDLTTVLFTLKFRNVGIFELMPVAVDAGGSAVPRLLAGMYCESMEFTAQ